MKNTFYIDFDFERLRESNRDDYRTPFQIDRDRIIHSSEFIRLQGKTQVFLPGEFDYYRTRLTHSIEVSQIGRSICTYLMNKENTPFRDDYFVDPDLVELSCLAHDLGHPPFGHAGERTLHKLMKPYGGFEGNAQTLRLITEIFYRAGDERRGMNPARASLDSVLKYKSLFSQLDNPFNHFIYDYQSKFIEFVFDGVKLPIELYPGEKLNGFKSIECQIMDWADDTAYAINDLVDSISGGFITIAKLLHWKEENKNKLTDIQSEQLANIIKWIQKGNYKAKFGSQIGEFILATNISERKTFIDGKTNRYKYFIEINEAYEERVKLYKSLSVSLVFQSPQIHQMEFKGDQMLSKLFKVFEENYITQLKPTKLLPDFTDHLIREEKDYNDRARLVCDYLSGMTDSFAMRTYKRLFDPNFSSIIDFV